MNQSIQQPTPRRRFLMYSTGALVAAGLAASGWWWLAARPQLPAVARPSGLGTAADTVLAGLRGTSVMGDWAREQYPVLTRPLPELVGLLRQRLALAADAQPAAAELEQQLRQAIQEDFANDKVIRVRGWQLSETEAVVAAIRWHMVDVADDRVAEQEAEEGRIAEITSWGPKETFVGQPANEQSGGYSALWVSGDIPRWAQVAISGVRVETIYRGDFVVANLRGRLQEKVLAEPGEHVLTLHDDMANVWQKVGVFKVLPAPGQDDKVTTHICKVTNWGPKQTKAGKVPNQQKNGDMGLWIDTLCVSDTIHVRFGDTVLEGRFNGHAVTTLVPAALLQQPGRIPLALVDQATNEEHVFGMFEVKAPG